MADFIFKGLIPGKKYRMVIEAATADGDIQMPHSIEFKVPEAIDHAKNFALDIKKVTTNTKNSSGKMVARTRLLFKIPKAIMSNLVWKTDVKDVVWIVYKSSSRRENMTSTMKYLAGDGNVSFTVPAAPDFTSSTWASGHPAVFYKNIDTSKYYSFQFIVARYTYQNATWTGKWLNGGSKLEDILSKQVTFGG